MLETDNGISAALQKKLHEDGTPFFVAQGIHRPHLPFHFPATFPGPVNDNPAFVIVYQTNLSRALEL